MLSSLLNRLPALLAPQYPLGAPLRALKLAGSGGEARKVNFFLFESRASRPTLMLKITRTPQAHQALRAEFESLGWLYQHPGLQPILPRPVALLEEPEGLLLLETPLPGRSLENDLCRGLRRSESFLRADLCQVAELLQTLWSQTLLPGPAYDWRTSLQPALSRLEAEISPSLRQSLLDQGQSLQGLSLPLAARHGDFWAGNVFLAAGRAQALDWETLERAADPLDDWFFFCLLYALRVYDFLPPAQALQRAFLRPSPLGLAAHALTRQHLLVLGLPPEAGGFFLAAFLCRLAAGIITLGRTGRTSPAWLPVLAQASHCKEFGL